MDLGPRQSVDVLRTWRGGFGGGWRGEGRSKQAAPVPTLCMQLSPQTLQASTSKDSAGARFTTFRR